MPPPSKRSDRPAAQVLNASFNKLASLPELGCLVALKTLNITSNGVADLPADLPSTLCTLLAPDNQLAALPPSVGLCAALAELDLAGNNLSTL